MQTGNAEKPAPKSKAESKAKGKAKPSGKRAAPNFRNHQSEGCDDKTEAERRRLCGNCGVRGHQAITCTSPCFACGGDHKYFECTHPELHLAARRQASRNRVKWTRFGAVDRDSKTRAGMKPSGAGKYWVRKEYDPDYTPPRDISPKRAHLDKHSHPSDRRRTSLRILWNSGASSPPGSAFRLNRSFLTVWYSPRRRSASMAYWPGRLVGAKAFPEGLVTGPIWTPLDSGLF